MPKISGWTRKKQVSPTKDGRKLSPNGAYIRWEKDDNGSELEIRYETCGGSDKQYAIYFGDELLSAYKTKAKAENKAKKFMEAAP